MRSSIVIGCRVYGAVLALATLGALAQGIAAPAQAAEGSAPIEIEYVPPANAYLRPVYEQLKRRQVLEQLRDFLSPLRLPVTLRIRTLQCDDTNAYWAGRVEGLKLCYEYIDWVERLAPTETTPDGFTPQDAIAGEIVEVTLHEMGHAVFDLFNVPIFGREEDAADQIAGFIMLQFGQDVALRTISGTAYAYQQQAKQSHWSHTTFSDEHETDEQRMYNYLCLGYGAQPATFQRFVDSGLLPAKRAANCGREYRQIRRAFQKTILPHVDQEQMKKVQAMQMLRPNDGIIKRDYAQ
jgi:Putative metallopeptidase